jgi:hypothetical protein
MQLSMQTCFSVLMAERLKREKQSASQRIFPMSCFGGVQVDTCQVGFWWRIAKSQICSKCLEGSYQHRGDVQVKDILEPTSQSILGNAAMARGQDLDDHQRNGFFNSSQLGQGSHDRLDSFTSFFTIMAITIIKILAD